MENFFDILTNILNEAETSIKHSNDNDIFSKNVIEIELVTTPTENLFGYLFNSSFSLAHKSKNGIWLRK